MKEPISISPETLCALALEARKNSYSPYSGFKVGASLLAGSGKIYTGCNIENAAFSPTVCAERVAFFKAISEGEKDFIAIAIAGGSGDSPNSECPPCGVCRQVMAEFCDTDSFMIYVLGQGGDVEGHTLAQLLPESFGKSNLK